MAGAAAFAAFFAALRAHDGEQCGVAGEHEVEGRNVFRHCYAVLLLQHRQVQYQFICY
jgi:hypothetical protein